jgi:hypothetical protein
MEVIRLSPNKIQINQTVEIRVGDTVIDKINVKTRYKIFIGSQNYFIMIPSESFINKLSQKYGIKKKFISIKTKKQVILLENAEFEIQKAVDYLFFSDIDWYIRYNRDLKIKELLK